MVLTSVATDATQKIKKKGTKDVGGDISDGGRSAIRIRLANTDNYHIKIKVLTRHILAQIRASKNFVRLN